MSVPCVRAMCAVALGLAAPLVPADAHPASSQDHAIAKPSATVITSQRDVARLQNLEGITLQWIGWDNRGTVTAEADAAGVWHLAGEQLGPDAALVSIQGVITAIGPDQFDLVGTITILNTPDEGRTCDREGTWRFAVTQRRTYYRVREFEWCDYLTDYVDIYFHPDLR